MELSIKQVSLVAEHELRGNVQSGQGSRVCYQQSADGALGDLARPPPGAGRAAYAKGASQPLRWGSAPARCHGAPSHTQVWIQYRKSFVRLVKAAGRRECAPVQYHKVYHAAICDGGNGGHWFLGIIHWSQEGLLLRLSTISEHTSRQTNYAPSEDMLKLWGW